MSQQTTKSIDMEQSLAAFCSRTRKLQNSRDNNNSKSLKVLQPLPELWNDASSNSTAPEIGDPNSWCSTAFRNGLNTICSCAPGGLTHVGAVSHISCQECQDERMTNDVIIRPNLVERRDSHILREKQFRKEVRQGTPMNKHGQAVSRRIGTWCI